MVKSKYTAAQRDERYLFRDVYRRDSHINLTEKEIQKCFLKALVDPKDKQNVKFNTYEWGGFESDIIYTGPDGKMYEFEIKTNLEDFFNDFSKQSRGRLKHDLIKSGECDIETFSFIVPYGLIGCFELPCRYGLYYARIVDGRVIGLEICKDPESLH